MSEQTKRVIQQRARQGGKNTESIHLLQTRIAELEAALRALVIDKEGHPNPAGVADYSGSFLYCVYCKQIGDHMHALDCPILVGRKVLGDITP